MDEKYQKKFTGKAYIAQKHVDVILNYKVNIFFLKKKKKYFKFYFITDQAFKPSGIF